MAVAFDELRQTMRRWVSGVTVVTSSKDDQRAGVTASSFTSVTLEPPVMLVCLQTHIQTYKLIEESKAFGLSILASDQAKLSAQFAGFVPLPEGEDRFYNVNISTSVTGSPILTDAAAWMDCRLHTIHNAGTTGIIIGEVVATGFREKVEPLVYHNRTYFDLKPQPPII